MSSVNKEQASLAACRKKGFSVAASPFNPIKLELGLILLFGLLLLLISGHLGLSAGGELLLLAGLAAVRLAWRTRSLLSDFESTVEREDGAQ